MKTLIDLIDKFRLRENSARALWLNLALIALTGFVMIWLFFYVYLPVTTHHGETITVPDLYGMSIEEVERTLKGKDLRYVIDDSTYDKKKPPLVVLVQNPVKESRVKINRRIHLTVNATQPPLERLPDIVDSSVKQAEQLLKNNGFEVGKINYVPDLAANAVINIYLKGKKITREEIRKGYLLPKGSTIDLDIGDGMGKDMFDLPNVVGKSYEDAEVILRGSNLSIGNVIYDPASSRPKGTVIRQKPDYIAGRTVKIGDVIDLWVAGSED